MWQASFNVDLDMGFYISKYVFSNLRKYPQEAYIFELMLNNTILVTRIHQNGIHDEPWILYEAGQHREAGETKIELFWQLSN